MHYPAILALFWNLLAALRSIVRTRADLALENLAFASNSAACGALRAALACARTPMPSAHLLPRIGRQTEPQTPDTPPRPSAEHLDPAAIKEKELQRAAAIEATLKTETRDSVWASTTEGQLRTAADAAVQEGAQYSVKTLKCLTSACGVVLSASSPHQLRYTSFQLPHRISGMGSFDIAPPETAADGSATVTCRLFRRGYSRPDEGT